MKFLVDAQFELEGLIRANLEMIATAFATSNFVELGRSALLIHE